MKKTFIYLVFCFLIFQPLKAQVFQFNRIIKGLDLPSDNVFEIIQDNEGKMWFNTSQGVYFSDGFFTYPLPDQVNSQLESRVGLLKDGEGKIWIYNHTGSLRAFYWDYYEWREYQFPQEIIDNVNLNQIKLFIEGKGENAVFAVQSSGFLAIKMKRKWDFAAFQYNQLGYLQSIFENDGSPILMFQHHAYRWGESGLEKFEMQGLDLPSPVSHIKFDEKRQSYFFLGPDFLASGKQLNMPEIIHHTGFTRNTYTLTDYSGLQIVNGIVFFHYNSHLYKLDLDKESIMEIDAFEELKSYNIYHAYIDREDIIWLGSHRGVLNIKSLRFQNFKFDPLLDDEVTALMELEPGQFLLGFNNGLQLFSKAGVSTVVEDQRLRGQPRNRITNFSRDKNGIIWFSSNLEGLGRFDPNSKQVSYAPSPLGKFVTAVYALGDSLYVVSRDRVYLSNIRNSGRSHFENDITEMFLERLDQEEAFFRKVGFLNDGRIVFMQGGSNILKDGLYEDDEMVTVVGFDFLDLGNAVLFGSEQGLKIWENGKFSFWELNGQQIRRPIYALLKDSRGHIWIGTDKGVYKYDGITLRNFGEKNGLSGSEINRGAFKEAMDGRIYIGTQRGLSIYYPEEDITWNFKPFVKMGKISLVSDPEEDFNPSKIPFNKNSVRVDFDAVSFLQVADLVVSYKLEGYHEEWVESVNPRNNYLYFNNLPAGEYQLHLKAGLRGLDFSDAVSSIKFTILKPIYLQGWFVILVLLIFLGIGFLLSTLLSQFKKHGALKKKIDQKTEEAKITEDQFRNVWNNSQDGLVISVEGGRILFANPAMAHLAGIDVNNIQDPNITDLFSDPDYYFDQRGRMLDMLSQSNGQAVKTDMKMPFRSGIKDVEFYITFLSSTIEGKKVLLSVFRDITATKQYEESLELAKEKAEESNRVKTSFLANISHEIRTPLNGILGTAENIMMERKDDKALVNQLEIIRESGERLLGTINSILDLSKIESNKMEVKYTETNLNDFLSKILVPLKSLALKKGLVLRSKFETQPFYGAIDQRYFEMIVNNLVGNAIKYSEKGVIQVFLQEKDGKLEFKVEDQGIGISEEFLSKIYSPFEQESRGYSRAYEGSGLGLVITKNLISLMKGEITVESEKGVGTCVTVLLPLHPN